METRFQIILQLSIFFLLAILFGCSSTKQPQAIIQHDSSADCPTPKKITPKTPLKPFKVSFKSFFKKDDLTKKSLEIAIESSLVYLKRIHPKTIFFYGSDKYTAQEIVASFKLFKQIIKKHYQSKDFIKKLEDNFYAYQSPGNKEKKVLFTGYYEPTIQGSLTKSDLYSIPVYTKPNDLIVLSLSKFRKNLKNRSIVYRMDKGKVLPYYTRKEIMEDNMLAGKKLEIAWFKNPIDLFFLQVQGSGVMKTPDGKTVRLEYNGANGQPYLSIGRLLLLEKKIPKEKISMQSIRKYLTTYPKEMNRVLFHNKSYVFFKLAFDNAFPKGNIGVPLTPKRSIATDYTLFPRGGLAYLKTTVPNFDKKWKQDGQRQISRFVLNQDTGGAIRSYARTDIFWGRGDFARETAGKLANYGQLFFIIAKKDKLKPFLSAPTPKKEKKIQPKLIYTIQVLATNSLEKAKQIVAKLKVQKFAAYIMDTGKKIFRVRVGKFNNKELLEKEKIRIQNFFKNKISVKAIQIFK
ncbi:MAG: membrane-bound lytic murein transglycosylase A [bacterium]|jgi:membrane-bound lytic murein transglycosylase A